MHTTNITQSFAQTRGVWLLGSPVLVAITLSLHHGPCEFTSEIWCNIGRGLTTDESAAVEAIVAASTSEVCASLIRPFLASLDTLLLQPGSEIDSQLTFTLLT